MQGWGLVLFSAGANEEGQVEVKAQERKVVSEVDSRQTPEHKQKEYLT